jgi:hypothetical protein
MKIILSVILSLLFNTTSINTIKYDNCKVSFGYVLVLPGEEEADYEIVKHRKMGCRCSVIITDANGNTMQAITSDPVNMEFCSDEGIWFPEDKLEVNKIFNSIGKDFNKPEL